MKLIDKIILLSYISTASSVSVFVTPALPEIEKYFALASGRINWIVSIFLFGYMTGQIVYGPLSNALGRVRALQIGLMINVLGIVFSLAAIPSATYSLMLLGRFISALGASAGLVCTIILINEGHSEQQAKQLLSYCIISFMLGIKISVLIGGLITSYSNWNYCFIFLVFHGMFMLALSTRLTETLPKSSRETPDFCKIYSGYKTALSSKQLVSFSLVLALATVISYSYAACGPLIGRFHLRLSASGYGLWNLLNAIGMLSGGFVSARLLKILKPIHVIVIGLISVFPCMFFLWIMEHFALRSPLFFFLITTFLYCGLGLVYAAASFYASNAIPCKANASGAMNFINMGSAVLVVSLMGFLPWTPLLIFISTITGYTLFASVLTMMRYKDQVAVSSS